MSNRLLKQVILENFQDHKNSTIDFTSGINLIVGSSDAGKSAILRAINFVFHNNLKGDSFIRHGSSECKVTLVFSDGIEVSRIKGNDVNSYHLKDSEGNNHSFPKVGTTVPEEIKKQLGQPPLDDKKKPISYADQMANLFLVDLSPTDLPRTLSELTGIQNLQNAAEQLSKNARSYDRVLKEKNDKINNLKDKLSNYDYVEKDLEAIEKIEKQLSEINSKIEKTNKARQFISNNNKIAQEAKNLKKSIQVNNDLFALNSKFIDLENLNNNLIESKKYLKSYKVFAEEFNTLKNNIAILKNFISKENLEKKNQIDNFVSKNNSAQKFVKALNAFNNEQKSIMNNIDDENSKINSNKIELKKLVDELKVKGNWCNSCNRPLV